MGGLAALALITAGICWLFVDPITRDGSHQGRAILAVLGMLTATGWLGVHTFRARQGVLAVRAILVMLCVVGWFNYFQFDRKILDGINDYTDTAYYYTNSKYLQELGYDGLYAGALACDAERGAPRTSHVTTIRDLRDDELRTRADGLAHGALVKENFTPERWAAFCHDITHFLDRLDKRALSTNFFVDHGYNPPPTWSVVGGNLTWLAEVEHLKWICHLDTVLLGLMFVGVAYWLGPVLPASGPTPRRKFPPSASDETGSSPAEISSGVLGSVRLEPMLWAMLFYTVTFSGRWPILGMAIMRFDWVVAIALGLVWLGAGRYGPAGGALAYASVNRVFPAIFLWGWLVESLLDTWEQRKVLRKHLHFVVGAVAVGGLLTGAAAVQYGPRTLLESAHHLALHNESFSSHRIGLGTVLSWRGETTREEINKFTFGKDRGMRAKELFVQSRKTGLHLAAVGGLLLILAYAWKVRRNGEHVTAFDLVPLVVLPLFCATTPQANYLNYRIVSYLWHGSAFVRQDRDAPFHAAGLVVLLGTEVAAQVAHLARYDRYSVNAISSVGMMIYCLLVLGYLIRRMARVST
jgi:hypothetical protein